MYMHAFHTSIAYTGLHCSGSAAQLIAFTNNNVCTCICVWTTKHDFLLLCNGKS